VSLVSSRKTAASIGNEPGLALETEASAEDGSRTGFSVHPGLSACSGGGPGRGRRCMHDFCTISLSDRLTPPGHPESRGAAAAALGDFVVVSNNRRSLAATGSWPGPPGAAGRGAHQPPFPVVLPPNGPPEEQSACTGVGDLTPRPGRHMLQPGAGGQQHHPGLQDGRIVTPPRSIQALNWARPDQIG